MTNELDMLLKQLGYSGRPQQAALFDHLIKMDTRGVVAQAGTGVGKSIAVLSAAAHLRRLHNRQVTIITPTILLMSQYMKSDVPAAIEAFDLDYRELKGRSHYCCAKSTEAGGAEEAGCLGKDAGCTTKAWTEAGYECEYQEAKQAASMADVVITNTDMFLVNEKILTPLGFQLFDTQGPLLVDESHQFEAKLKDWAGTSIRADFLSAYRSPATTELAKWIRKHDRDPKNVQRDPQLPTLVRAAHNALSQHHDPGSRIESVRDGLGKILPRLSEADSRNYVVWTDGEALKFNWINIAASAREILTARPFGLVSATIPNSMPSSLGVADAKVVDVGHPFDYAKQATISISPINGAYQYAKEKSNLQKRAAELKEQILKHEGGALCLFSSFRDMENVYEEIVGDLRKAGLTVLKQGGLQTNQELGEQFKRDGNAVLFGSESFATGFDAPKVGEHDPLRLVAIWKVPYPGMDPVTKALANNFPARYNDLMLTRVTQAVGRLIRTVDDEGHVWIGDSRAEGKILGDNSLMTRHLKEFARHA
jgi:Rad3-related DNA helicase